ncbi:MAG: hemolysin III family protein [Ignavibacteriales bacterium]|nr:hemolysin III family protein [Ignavibacteriales bacterium]
MFHKFRDPFSGLSHLVTAISALVGLIFLIFTCRGDLIKLISLLVYGMSLIIMFSISSAYHLTSAKPKTIEILRKLDHSAIFILIAGTYTPICINLLTGFWRWGLLIIIWLIAIIGIIVKLFIIKAPRWISASIYVAMGWLALIAMNEIVTVFPTGALIWLFLGGVIFTLGSVIYSFKLMNFVPGVFGFHEVWHIFVILGGLCHYILIFKYVAQAV